MKRTRACAVTLVAIASLAGSMAGPAAGSSVGSAAPGARSSSLAERGVVVWTHRAAEGSEQLMVARPDGSDARALTKARADTIDIDAQVSPDGRWVAYERQGPNGARVRLVRPNGRDDHKLQVRCSDPCLDLGGPTWLSRQRIAFTKVMGPIDDKTEYAAAAALWSARIDGSDVRRVSARRIDGVAEEYYLRLSADRTFMTFLRLDLAKGQTALFRRSRDGTDEQRLTPWAISAEVNDLSTARRGPTRNLLVFESYGRRDPDQTFVDVATVPATCGSRSECKAGLTWLTDNAATGRRNANPQWSPSGRRLVLTDRPSIDDENANVFQGLPVVGPVRSQISVTPEFDYRPTWGRD